MLLVVHILAGLLLWIPCTLFMVLFVFWIVHCECTIPGINFICLLGRSKKKKKKESSVKSRTCAQ